MFDWLDIQWQRFNIWLDYKRQFPGHRVVVRYVKDGEFRVARFKRVSGAEAIERDWQNSLDEGEKKQRRLNPFITEREVAEWREGQEEKRREDHRKRRTASGFDNSSS